MRGTRRIRALEALSITAVLAVFAGCAVTPVTNGLASTQPVTNPMEASTTPTIPSATTAPLQVTTTPIATPTVAATTPAAKPSPPPEPFGVETLTKGQRQALGSCLKQHVSPGSSGTCTKLALKYLKSAGLYKGKSTSYVNVSGANAILNYQRSRGIVADATVGSKTWVALASHAPVIPEVIPAECKSKGVVLCVDKAHRKMTFLRDGKTVKTFAIRVGGWNNKAKTNEWRVFPTASGTWKVYDKQVNPYSKTYGAGAMPYSTMFYPDMYVHYSPGFASQGYAGSSHGCVNIRKLADAKWIFKNTPIGSKVFVFGGRW